MPVGRRGAIMDAHAPAHAETTAPGIAVRSPFAIDGRGARALCHVTFGNRLTGIAGNSGSTPAAAKSPMPHNEVLSATWRQARRSRLGNWTTV